MIEVQQTVEPGAFGRSDSTPDIAYTYNRIGQQLSVSDAVGSRTFAYNNALQLTTESISGIYSKTITRNYEASGMIGKYKGLNIRAQSVCVIERHLFS